ncbi:uncharacterized protein DSM5745_07354 [Aspergillus mulundensis]|uniref:Uncharacterized protein n=1 Tax=Aspergillus mulundensis TaxID=1810919 RepID=A0A3D8RKT7_9EURO|nr:hypothetical protein DSM5745_07354 [Aspergillus mulundensis]RDW74692.1 hypothetical protein DSM5745_07354 [Aspergillus mulundensis]
MAMKKLSELTGYDLTSYDITGIIASVFADRPSYGLEESRHAPKKGARDSYYQCPSPALGNEENFTLPSSLSPSISLSASSHPSSCCNTSPVTTTRHQANMGTPIADVDDTAGFMEAARAFKLEKEYGKPPTASEDESSEQDAPQFMEDLGDAEEPVEANGGFESDGGFGLNEAVRDSSPPQSSIVDPKTEEQQPEAEQVCENREDLMTFQSWGAPGARDKPAAQIRRVIIKDLPSSWRSPDKVLSLIHGGLIESVSVTPTGNAHVLFCDAAACKAFYEKYPNGIDLDKERKLTVFVNLGQEVDVVSSQLSFSLAAGASRVVRAVGVEMNVTLGDLAKFATAGNRKVEKIIDTYVPGSARSVSFRFCNILDAVRFRAAFVRVEAYEQCNVHYASDPCEVATGYHAD